MGLFVSAYFYALADKVCSRKPYVIDILTFNFPNYSNLLIKIYNVSLYNRLLRGDEFTPTQWSLEVFPRYRRSHG